MLHTYSLTFVFSQDGRKAPTTVLWYHVSRNRFCDCLRTLEHMERWIPRSHFRGAHFTHQVITCRRASSGRWREGAWKRKMISLFQLRIFRIMNHEASVLVIVILAIIFSYIPGTRNIPFKVVVSIKWFYLGNGCFTKHPLKYGC